VNTNIKKLRLRMGANPPIDVDLTFSETTAPLDELRFWRGYIRLMRSQNVPAKLVITIDIEFMKATGEYRRVWKLDTVSDVPTTGTCIVSFSATDVIATGDVIQDKMLGYLYG
jgi:hypothetical protein